MTDHNEERDAVLSDCKQYRYLLRRVWDRTRMRALFVMLNPSTADAKIDDATIRSCRRLCKSWGYGSFEVVNLFGWRATKPTELNVASDPIGAENNAIISAAVSRCDVVVCAWGAFPVSKHRINEVRHLIGHLRPQLYCLGTTKNGHPKHPLYIKTGTMPEVYAAQELA